MSQVGEQGAAANGVERSCDVDRDHKAILVSQVGEQKGGEQQANQPGHVTDSYFCSHFDH